ncbi:MAG: FHA domain-containing protein [Myxococcales bacterium]|nr:FHA domain-containing protein [Myxococcales bacterium]
MAAKLILLGGDHPVEHPLSSFNTLGRHPDNSIQVLDRIVSKEHSRITLGPDGRYVIRDVGSLNGTFVNGEKVSERVLKSGDQISLGNTTYRFTEDRPQDKVPIRKVTMTPDQVQSQVQSTLSASSRFLPANDIKDIAVLKADYEKLRIAHELSQRLSIDADLDTLLQKIVDEAFQLIRADRAVILLLDSEKDEFVARYVRQKRDEEIKLSKSILDEVRMKKRAVLSSDAMVDERFKAAKSIIMQGIRSTMCVPLLYNDRLLGAMHVDSMLATGAFTERDLLLFSGIATQAAVAIENNLLANKIEHEASKRAQFQRLLSPNLVEQIVSGQLTLNQGGSRRDVTMLFADIRGFTAMSERHPPEEMVVTLNEYFEVMVDVLFRHGGTLDKYVGDEVIGLFGAPVELPDAPLRSVRCALDMMRALEEFNRLRQDQGRERVSIGIGVNTGPVIAGAIGSSRTLQYTVIGDAVNIAARLCSLAKPGEIIISESTLQFAGPHIIVEPRKAVQLRGRREALPIYAVQGIRDSAPPSNRSGPLLQSSD